MGHKGYNRQWSRHAEEQWCQHRPGAGGWGQWSGSWGRPGHGGPPPWVAGLFGLAQGEQQRGPRVRRGDVRAAILDVLREEPMNGYQVMSQIAERTGGEWKPSPGSVYPTIQQLEDEGLIEGIGGSGQRKLKPTHAGWDYISENADELAAVWAPFESRRRAQASEFAGLKPEIGQVMGAVWQIVTTGTEAQRRDAVEILVETRRRLYGLLADGEADETEEDRP